MVDALPALLRCNHPTLADSRSDSIRPRAGLLLKPLYLAVALGIFAGVSLPVQAESSCTNPNEAARLQAAELDWVPLSELTPAQRAALPTACCGAYVTPTRDDEDALADPASSTLRARADSSDAQLQSEIVMQGNVEITQGYRSVRADHATYSQTERKAQISGDIQIREPGMLMRAERAHLDIDRGDASLEEAQFVLHETRIRGQAARLEKFGDRLFTLEDGRFTSCEPGSNIWSVAGAEIEIHPEKHYGIARHMRLNIMDVPVLYAPYIRFPVGKERLTGFLFPSLGVDTRRKGIDDVEIPFYWNIAPNYDMTLTPRYQSEHGALLDVEARHLSRSFETIAEVSYMPSDNGNYDPLARQRIEDGLKTDYSDESRWLLHLDQIGGKGERWNTLIDYTDLSDTDYMLEVNGSSLDANRQAFLTQLAAADYRTDNWLVGIKAEEFRLLTEDQLRYRELPRVHADGAYRFDEWQLTLDNEYTHFDRNSHYTGDAESLILGERLRTDYSLTWNKELQWGFFKPGAAYKTLNYQLDDRALVDNNANSPRLQSAQASLDTGFYFERDVQLSGDNFVQTLEPRLYYLYSEYDDHAPLYGLTTNNQAINFDTAPLTFNYDQLFRDTRFAGGDRLEDANQVSMGLSSAWIDQSTGIERLRMSVGQILYLEDNKVHTRELTAEEIELQEHTSPIAAQISGQFDNGLRMRGDLFYDHRTEQVDGGSVSLRYMDENYRIFNLAYRYSRDPVTTSPTNPVAVTGQPLDQLDAAVIWPVSNQWSVIARSNYDFHYELELDTFAGLEYNDCCYRVRVMARRWLDFDYSENFLERVTSNDYREALMVDIQLKGLGNISERIGKLLDRAVIGYSDREQSLR